MTHCSPTYDTLRKRLRAPKTINSASKKTIKVEQPAISSSEGMIAKVKNHLVMHSKTRTNHNTPQTIRAQISSKYAVGKHKH